MSSSMTKTIGVTGGIGAGKSIICKLLSSLGYPVFYSDSVAKLLMNTSPALISEIKAIFGEEAYKNNELNRPFLSKAIFNNKELIEKMNLVVHPAVRKAFDNFAKNTKSNLVFNEAAILFETGAYKNFDEIILVTATQDTRIKRVKKRDNLSTEDILKRINNQWSDDKKSKLSKYIISNNDDDLLTPQVLQILNQLTSS